MQQTCFVLFFHLCIIIHTGHRCNKPGCGNVIIIDGNMKNHRAVCAANEAGYVQYENLPGIVKTGCMNTPDIRSQYCSIHKPRAAISNVSTHNVVEMILEKRVTRNKTCYKVV